VASGASKNGYELLKRLATGGMGEVFVARKLGAADFEKRVALKLLLPHLTASPESVKRFYAEARLAARMHHPNIVEIFDVGEAEGRPFIAMQLIEGVSLAQYLAVAAEQHLTTPLPIVRAIALAICEALSYAHDLTDGRGKPLKLVHRDVTPSNVLLSFNGAVQLTDFGIARVGDVGTRTGTVHGKASYVAPEQLTHERPVDARADLYSAAVTLYEVLTNQSPFRRASQDETFAAVLLGKITPVRELRDDLSPQMEAALQKALSRRPDARFADATAFRKAFIDGPVASGPDLADHLKLLALTLADAPVEPSGPGTRSQVLHISRSVSVDVTPEPARSLWPAWLAAGLGITTAAGLAVGGLRSTWEPYSPVVESVPAPRVPQPLAALPPVEPKAVEPKAVEPKPVEALQVQPQPTEPPPVAPVTPIAVVDPKGPRPRPRPAPPPPPPVGSAAKLQVGYLAADAEPWADVLVDGARIDRTPFSRYPLPTGTHEVIFKAADGRSERRSVTIGDGVVTSLRVDFTGK
jgi:serine/threonine-protein kinase